MIRAPCEVELEMVGGETRRCGAVIACPRLVHGAQSLLFAIPDVPVHDGQTR